MKARNLFADRFARLLFMLLMIGNVTAQPAQPALARSELWQKSGAANAPLKAWVEFRENQPAGSSVDLVLNLQSQGEGVRLLHPADLAILSLWNERGEAVKVAQPVGLLINSRSAPGQAGPDRPRFIEVPSGGVLKVPLKFPSTAAAGTQPGGAQPSPFAPGTYSAALTITLMDSKQAEIASLASDRFALTVR